MIELKKILNNKNKTISVAESLTSGNLQSILSSINGASSFFKGGITAYNIDIKNKFFDINYENAKKCDCVSEEVALAMAKGVSEIFDSNYSISTTGFAVPNETILVPYAYICFFDKDNQKYEIKKVENENLLNRVSFQKYLTNYAINYFINEFVG